jgi:hypothetical protein
LTFFLPVGHRDEHRAMVAVTRYLEEQKAGPSPIEGYTRSIAPEAVFIGYWWDEEGEKPARERVALFIIDYKQPAEDPENRRFDKAIGQLERAIKSCYRRYKRPQKVIWIITQQATRYG